MFRRAESTVVAGVSALGEQVVGSRWGRARLGDRRKGSALDVVEYLGDECRLSDVDFKGAF